MEYYYHENKQQKDDEDKQDVGDKEDDPSASLAQNNNETPGNSDPAIPIDKEIQKEYQAPVDYHDDDGSDGIKGIDDDSNGDEGDENDDDDDEDDGDDGDEYPDKDHNEQADEHAGLDDGKLPENDCDDSLSSSCSDSDTQQPAHTPGLSDYELMRLERIRRNRKHLLSLGLGDKNEAPNAAAVRATKKRRTSTPSLSTASVKRSSRIRKHVNYAEPAVLIPSLLPSSYPNHESEETAAAFAVASSADGDGNTTARNVQEQTTSEPYDAAAEVLHESAILDHVIRVGCYWKQKALRYEAWRLQQTRSNDTSDAESLSDHPAQQAAAGTSSKPARLHAQDTHIYATKSGYSNGPWPKMQKRLRVEESQAPDTVWDKELGDGIHPVAFSYARLASPPSGVHSSHYLQKLEAYASMDLDPDAAANDIRRNDACKALLDRAWERAVHAASSTVSAGIVPKHHDQPEQKQRRASKKAAVAAAMMEQSQSEVVALSSSVARERCKKMGLLARPPTAPTCATTTNPGTTTSDGIQQKKTVHLKCPSCDASFSSAVKLNRHYYGNTETRGCCWALLARESRAIVDSVLEKEVQAQLEGLVHLIVSQTKLSKHADKQQVLEGTEKLPNVLNWERVVGVLECVLASSRKTGKEAPTQEEEYGCLLQTLETDRSRIPLLINRTMIDNIRKRLVDRYGDVPR